MWRLMIIFCIAVMVYDTDCVLANMKVSSYDTNTAVRAAGVRSGSFNPSSVIATSESTNLQVLGFWFVNNGLTYSDDMVVMRVAFNNFLFDSSDGSVTIEDINLISAVDPDMTGDPLVYPNPMRFTDGGTLQYVLTTEMDIEIQMYDIFGHMIYQRSCAAASECGQQGYNNIELDESEFDYELSSGVYFYLFIYEDEVIGTGKLAVVP